MWGGEGWGQAAVGVRVGDRASTVARRGGPKLVPLIGARGWGSGSGARGRGEEEEGGPDLVLLVTLLLDIALLELEALAAGVDEALALVLGEVLHLLG